MSNNFIVTTKYTKDGSFKEILLQYNLNLPSPHHVVLLTNCIYARTIFIYFGFIYLNILSRILIIHVPFIIRTQEISLFG